ncbi:MAG: L,D-transpeptidase family protein [Desulfovibrio sp.]|nr:L,D-transpeptidase family protein [Desulfovibrio sp.]
MRRPDRNSFGRAIIAPILAVLLFCPGLALCDDWAAPLNDTAAPPRLVGVDKKNRTFNFFEKKSPLKLRYSYPCVTGQLRGDKTRINDLRTPEGVYFVEYKIASGLDFREYGGVAYTLNYPNPVDRLRGKTGHGIWIHSKGFELAPTRGCVAIGLKDIAEVGPLLSPGTAVVVGEELREPDGDGDETLNNLKEKMRSWSEAWSNRSPELFKYYDPAAYTLATENFASFRLNKERLFKILSFIKIFNREIHALEGPGYWVTWAEQLYTASNLSTEGVRRLYWQKGDDGDFRIVGMEWIPRDVGMRAELKQGKLVAEAARTVATDAASEAPVAPRLDMPEQAPEKTGASRERIQGNLFAGLNISAEKLAAASEPLVPKKRPRGVPPDEIEWGKGKKMNDEGADTPRSPAPHLILQDTGRKPASASSENSEQRATAEPATVAPEGPKPEAPKPVAAEPEPEIIMEEKELAAKFDAWLDAYTSKDHALLEFYDFQNFNSRPIPGATRRLSPLSVKQRLNADLKAPWLFVVANPPKIDVKGSLGKSEAEMMIVGPQGAREGLQSLWWRKNAKGEINVISADFSPSDVDLDSRYLELVSRDIGKMLEGWRLAWEQARLDDYMSYYAPNATQSKRSGLKSIRRNKELLWDKVKPAYIQFSGMRFSPDKKGYIRADMNQAYADSSGKKDKGLKTLILKYDGHRWLIQREDWIAEKPGAATTN